MFSNKMIYYYFSLTIAIVMFLLVILVGGVGLYVDGNLDDAWTLIRKLGAVGMAFLLPPVLYKLFAKEKQPSDKGKNLSALYLIICVSIWTILMGVATGLLHAGLTKAAVWVYISTIIPVFFIFLPLYYGIIDYFRNYR